MHRQLVPLRLRRPLAGLLLCALLLTQVLGVLHRSVHPGGPPMAHAERAEHVEHVHGGLEALFAQHHDAGDCQIFDQLSHADGVGFVFAETGAMPPAPSAAAALQVPRLAAQAAGYLARGPPQRA
jgi:hypothetical protein